jgi:photosystem II stability/assembly factor-like uncharacterized protein
MKTIQYGIAMPIAALLIWAFLLLSASLGYSQTAWQLVRDRSIALSHWVVAFPSKDTGYLSGQSAIERTTDGGKTWKPLNYPFWGNITARIIKFANNRVGYIRGGDGRGGFTLKTQDGGETWQKLPEPEISDWREFLAPTPDTLFILSKNGLYRSVDGGHSFQQRRKPEAKAGVFIGEMNFFSGKKGIAYGIDYNAGSGFPSYFWGTEDGGQTWSLLCEHYLPRENRQSYDALQLLSPQDWIFTGSYPPLLPSSTYQTMPFLYRTRDGGKTWQALPIENPEDSLGLGRSDVFHFVNRDTGYVFSVAIGPRAPENRHIISQTQDGGKTWSREHLWFDSSPMNFSFPTACTGYLMLQSSRVYKTTSCGRPVSTEPLPVKESGFSVFPSPAPLGQAQRLRFAFTQSARLRFTLQDALGRVYPLFPWQTYPAAEQELTFTAPGPGLWFLRIEQENAPPAVIKFYVN